ncbi:CU044_2847 family protein [Streptomyces sp. NPDC059894]|uniref:CU044_2847 family protein n=1 Tax=unclassified Streptomyces TaxID=2593676 RepID=UPI00365E14F0
MAIVTRVAAGGLGESVLVEVDSVPAESDLDDVFDGVRTRQSVADRVVRTARDVYDDGLDLARRCAVQAAQRIGEFGEGLKPDEVELQLAIRLDAELGAVLVKSKAEAQLQVTFRWKPGGTS